MNQKIIDYLQQNRDQYSKEDLIKALQNSGYENQEIQEGIENVYGKQKNVITANISLKDELQNHSIKMKELYTLSQTLDFKRIIIIFLLMPFVSVLVGILGSPVTFAVIKIFNLKYNSAELAIILVAILITFIAHNFLIKFLQRRKIKQMLMQGMDLKMLINKYQITTVNKKIDNFLLGEFIGIGIVISYFAIAIMTIFLGEFIDINFGGSLILNIIMYLVIFLIFVIGVPFWLYQIYDKNYRNLFKGIIIGSFIIIPSSILIYFVQMMFPWVGIIIGGIFFNIK